jgi:hypothetical protein
MIREVPNDMSSDDLRNADHFLAAALRQDMALPSLGRPDLIPERALYHGVSALLATLSAVMATLPSQIQDAVRQQAISETMWDLRHRQILAPLLNDFAKADIVAVLLKGTALAYSHYPSSSLRPRGDTDMLVPASEMANVFGILKAHGFSRDLGSFDGMPTSIIRQEAWSYTAPDGSKHAVDLHWEVMHPWAVSHLFDSDTVRRKAQPLERLSPSARMMCNIDAVYHACIHRAVHIKTPYYIEDQAFRGGDRLIWLYDLHLMLPKLTTADWADLLSLCGSHDTADLCLDAFTKTNQLLGTHVPSDVLDGLRAARQNGAPKQFLVDSGGVQSLFSDLRAIPTLKARLQYMLHVLFPPKAFLIAKYPDMASKPVVLMYLRRIFAAALRKKPDNSQ